MIRRAPGEREDARFLTWVGAVRGSVSEEWVTEPPKRGSNYLGTDLPLQRRFGAKLARLAIISASDDQIAEFLLKNFDRNP